MHEGLKGFIKNKSSISKAGQIKRFKKVPEGSSKRPKVQKGSRSKEGLRRFNKVQEGSRRLIKVHRGSQRFSKVQKVLEGLRVQEGTRMLMNA